MSEPQRSILAAEPRMAAWLVDRDGIVLAQSDLALRLLGDLSGREARAVLADRDPGGLSVRMLGWCLALGERHAAVFGGRSLVMQPVGAGALVTFGRPAPAPARLQIHVGGSEHGEAARFTLELIAAA